jgi:hypothetical protein
LPSLGAKRAWEAIFHPMRPAGHHFKPPFKVFPAMFRFNAPDTKKWAKKTQQITCMGHYLKLGAKTKLQADLRVFGGFFCFSK